MLRNKLGRTDIEVSVIGLGTMTWGNQNDEGEAHSQLDYAIANGVNTIDAAEIYPFPISDDSIGRTESIIGTWLSRRKDISREDLVIASKVAGPSNFRLRSDLRQSRLRLDRANIISACDESLRRLCCDYIDLYYLHWPERTANFFGRRGFSANAESDRDSVPLEESFSALAELLQAGKVRTIALSNETPWGLMHSCAIAEGLGIRDRFVAVQNPYSLINRSYETGLAEVSYREDIGLFAYSPLGGGVLSGKYLQGALPDKSRGKIYPQHTTRYRTPTNALSAIESYVSFAQEHGLVPAQMALSFVNSRPFVSCNIIGATTMEQLAMNIASADVSLSAEVLQGLDAIEERYPSPCP